MDVEAIPFSARPIEPIDDRVEQARIARRGVRGRRVENGHCIGYTRRNASGAVHAVGSVVAQLEQGQGFEDGLDPDNLRFQKIAGRGRRNIIFIVDASGSMLSAERLAMVKGCVLSLLEDAYIKRTRVALISYGGLRAELVLPFTSSAEMAARRISDMKGGGGTPLVEALGLAAQLIERLEGESSEIILLSDGRYNHGQAAERRLRSFGIFCARKDVPIHLVDAGTGGKTARRRVALLAGKMHADLRSLDDLRV